MRWTGSSSVGRLVAVAMTVPLLITVVGVAVHVVGLQVMIGAFEDSERALIDEAIPLGDAHLAVDDLKKGLNDALLDGALTAGERDGLIEDAGAVADVVESTLVFGPDAVEAPAVAEAVELLRGAASRWPVTSPQLISLDIAEAAHELAEAHRLAVVDAADEARSARIDSEWAVGLGLVLSVIGTFGVIGALVVLVRQVVRPVRDLTSRVRQRDGLGGDDSIPGHGPTELRDLAHALDELHAAVRRSREDLEKQALTDPLTGLANRSAFGARLERGAAGLVLVDLDAFKQLNDTEGHDAGDEVLRAVASRPREIAGPDDLAARLGGDEFAVVVAGDRARVRQVAEAVVDQVARPVEVRDRSIPIGVSAGWADGGPDASRHADLALYAAKTAGRGRAVGYEDAIGQVAVERDRRLRQLRTSLDRREFAVALQPIVELRSSRIVGWEALARWQHPELGELPAGAFIEDIESERWSGDLFEIVAAVAADAMSVLDAAGGSNAWVSLNVAPEQLETGAGVRQIAACLAEVGLDVGRVVLEVTERTSAPMDDEARAELAVLRGRGLRIAVDDFGAGYSTFSSLRLDHVDVVKLDRTLVAGIEDDRRGAVTVDAVRRLVDAHGMDLIAEGIETAGQLGILTDRGVLLGQGYHLARPMPVDEAARLVTARDPSAAITSTS